MFKIFRLRQLLKRLGLDKHWVNQREEEDWLSDQWHSKGFKSYLYVRDISILKSIAEAVRARDFQTALELSGRRLELLRMADNAKNTASKEA